MPYRAIQVTRAAGEGTPNAVELVQLPESSLHDPALGELLIDVEYSSLNYKDGLALTGKPGIVRADRMTAGIDVVGTVIESSAPGVADGDRVLVNGCGLGETHPGGLAELARVRAEWALPVPERFTTRQAAAVGTAGFTAALGVLALQQAGLKAGAEVAITGAAGGVGTIALLLGSAAGWRLTAVTGRTALGDTLRALGASDVLDRAQLAEPGKSLQSARWDGAIDAVGGEILANVIAQLRYGGTVAACGNAASSTLAVSMMPFILRAATLTGINSVDTPRPQRREAWGLIDRGLDLDRLDSLTEEISLGEAINTARRFGSGAVFGRIVVNVRE